MNTRRTGSVNGREARVDICPYETGFVLSIGRTSIWLERTMAEDLVETLERALLMARATTTAAGDDRAPDGQHSRSRSVMRRTNVA
jgi:hypothetical protein